MGGDRSGTFGGKEPALHLTQHRWARPTGRVTGQLQSETQQAESNFLSPLPTPEAWEGGREGVEGLRL